MPARCTPGHCRLGLPTAGHRMADPPTPSHCSRPVSSWALRSYTAEFSEFRMLDGPRAKDYWVLMGQTATDAQIDMLERSGAKPSKDHSIKFFTLGVPHTQLNRDKRASFVSRRCWARPFRLTTRKKIRPATSDHRAGRSTAMSEG